MIDEEHKRFEWFGRLKVQDLAEESQKMLKIF